MSGYVGVRPWVISHMLDLCGYVQSQDLVLRRIVEPAVGDGAILGAVVQRLSASCRAHGYDIGEAYDSLIAYDVDSFKVREARVMVVDLLLADDWPAQVAVWLAASWVRHGDYLLVDRSVGIDHVVCRPPYTAFNHIPQKLYESYRSTHTCLNARSDAYIAFLEHALPSLGRGGNLVMIVPTNWLGSHSGGKLRNKIYNGYAIDLLLDLTEADVFDRRISGLTPMICVIRNGLQQSPVVAEAKRNYYHPDGQQLHTWLEGTESTLEARNVSAHRLTRWPYSPERRWRFRPSNPALIRIHQQHPRLGSHPGIRIGHGVRTGLDVAFLAAATDPVEPDRLVPIAQTSDVQNGRLVWQGQCLVNPWDDQGRLVKLEAYPLMADWLGRYRQVLSERRAIGDDLWYRTNDAFDSSFASKEKLLLPKLCHRLLPLYDDIGLYPHFHFCYIASDSWSLEALGGLLISRVVNQLIREHCQVGRGGSLHLRAGALSSMPIPVWSDVPVAEVGMLELAFRAGDVELASLVADRLYDIKPSEY